MRFRKNIFLLFILSAAGLVPGSALTQTQTITRSPTFVSVNQNMWGPNGSPFTLNKNISIFNFPFNATTPPVGAITNLAGYKFGGTLDGGIWGGFEMKFIMQGFTTGSLDVDYPVQVDITAPADSSFDKGENITLNTNYTVLGGANFNTVYPNAGELRLDLIWSLGMQVNLTICAFTCLNIPIIPYFNIAPQTLNIFKVDQTGAEILGPVYPFTNLLCTSGFPPCVPGKVILAASPAVIPDNDFGISGSLAIPSVSTTSSVMGNNCLKAYGQDPYANINLELFKLISNFVTEPITKTILGNLSGSFALPDPFGSVWGAELNYTIMSASFDVNNYNTQNFTFCPTINMTLGFSTKMDYTVTDPANGNSLVSSGSGTSVQFEVGHDLNLSYPCDYDFVEFTPIFEIENTVTNTTYDSLALDFLFSALEFSVDLPSITIIPEICFPEVCINIPYPCPTWSKPWKWCSKKVCTPAFCTPALVFPGFSWGFGPLLSLSQPIASINIPYYSNSWELGGFNIDTGSVFTLIPRKYFANMDSVDVACNGDQTGSATVNVTNGNPPFTFEWHTNAITTSGTQTSTLSNIGAGSAFAKVTDANGCQILASSYLNGPILALGFDNAFTTNVDCNTNSSGAIDIAVSGGTAPYSYAWSNAATTQDLNSIAAGQYDVIVTDANGCQVNDTFVVTEPSAVSASIVQTDVTCFGFTNGAADLSIAGGTAPYTVLWSTGSTLEDIGNLAAGPYNVTVTDLNNCVATASTTVIQPVAAVTTSSVVTDVTCFGFSDGIIDVTVAGGTPPYTFNWINNSYQVLTAVTEDISNQVAEIYTVFATDSKGCGDTLVSTISEPAALAVTNVKTHVNCFGQSTGAIDITVTGGNIPYSYSWSNGATTEDISAIPAGNYSVTVTDLKNCTITLNTQVDQPAAGLSSMITPVHVLCFGNATGEADLQVTGGTQPYSYSWSNSSVAPKITGLIAAQYVVTITDGKACLLNDTIDIIEPVAPLGIANIQNMVTCFGFGNGSIDLTTTGGTVPYTFQWSTSNSQILSAVSEDILNLGPEVYTVLVSDANACITSSSFTITEPPAINLSSSLTAVNCFAGTDGDIDLTVTGGTLNYTYLWSNSAATQDLASIPAGTYTVTITDGNNCTKTASYQVTQPDSALVAVTVEDAIGCSGAVTGGASVSASGGTFPYTYLWSNGATTPDIDSIPAGVYAVVVTDANNCIANSGTVVTEPGSPLILTTTVDSLSCFGIADGHIQVSIAGGTMPYKYQWADSSFLLNQTLDEISGIPAGTYTIFVTDRNECKESQTVQVMEPDEYSVSFTTDAASCFGGSDASINITVGGGTLPYSFIWSNGGNAEDLNNIAAGLYSVVITDANGCQFEQFIPVGQSSEILIESEIGEISCKDQADGFIRIIASGGTQPYTFIWSNGGSNDEINDLGEGTYTLVLIDDQSCQFTADYELTLPANECVNIPTSFTPNADGINDTWVLRNLDLYVNATVEIFNQWGTVVFDSQGQYQAWDGRYMGSELPASTYYYVIDLGNGDAPYSGAVTIVR